MLLDGSPRAGFLAIFVISFRALCALFLPGVAYVALASVAAATTPEKPNILIFLSDDMGWGDSLAYNSDSLIPMPNLEQLAAEGMVFMDAHTAAVKCAPTRYTILTGNYQWRGLKHWGQGNWKGGSQILEGQWTLGDILKQHGYNTAFIGKLHLGGDFYRIGSDDFVAATEAAEEVDFSRPFESGPLDFGFDYSFLALKGIQNEPYAFFEDDRLVGDPNEMIIWEAGQYGDSIIEKTGIGMPYWDSSQVGPDLTESAIAFIDHHHNTNLAQNTDTPFLLYYSSQSAHYPFTPPETFFDKPVRGITGMTAHSDMVYEIDVALGELIDALTQRGLADNTLIIFTSDNGGVLASQSFGHDSVGGLRGHKSRIWEGGHRVPLVVKWGDGSPASSMIPPGTTSNQLIGTHDLMATIAALVGETLPEAQARDSFNFLPVFLGEIGDESPVRDHLIMEANKLDEYPDENNFHFAYREGSWKLVFDQYQNVMGLYNLATDIGETLDLKADPDETNRIDSMVSNFQALYAAERTAPLSDIDSDGVPDHQDNCKLQANGPLITDAGGNSQRDSDGDGYGNVCDADLDNDCAVNFSDLGLMKSVFFGSESDSDLNGDGVVNFVDLGLMKTNFFEPPGPSGVASDCDGQ